MRCRSCTRSCNLLKVFAKCHCLAPAGWEGADDRREPEYLPFCNAFGIKSEGHQPDFYSPVTTDEWGMKRIIIFLLLLGFCETVWAWNGSFRVIGYRPAPGQFINQEESGTPGSAGKLGLSEGGLVSLGGFGGTLVLAVDPPLINHPLNPYGIDFTLFGNAFEGSSEPGIIWVMKDANGNGKPDDGWYQIAGSAYFDPSTRFNHTVTWFNTNDSTVSWKDDAGSSGRITRNSFHNQPYYPLPELFPEYPHDSVITRGTLLPVLPDTHNGIIGLPAIPFGYADNRGYDKEADPGIPDNPYTPGIREGAGGDPVDIAWAVDEQGNYADLDQVHFLKIVTGAFSNAGTLGEVSTEIASVAAVKPTGTTGPETLPVIFSHPRSILAGDTLQLAAGFFRNGKIQNDPLFFSCNDQAVLSVSESGLAVGQKGGLAVISASPSGFQETAATTFIKVREPDSIDCPGYRGGMYTGISYQWRPVLLDQNKMEIKNMSWVTEIEDSTVASVTLSDGGICIQGLKPGFTFLNVRTRKYPDFKRRLSLTVVSLPNNPRIFATAKTQSKNLFPFQRLTIEGTPLNQHIEKRAKDYSAVPFISLAHVIAEVMTRSSDFFKFREHPSGNGLYLYSVEREGFFTYGWGGKTDPPAYARAWIVRKNRQHYVSGLETIPVNDMDTIMIYHVDNILVNWQLSALTTSPDSAVIGDKVEIQASAVTCRFSEGKIVESLIYALSGRPVGWNNNKGSSLLTDGQGRASLELIAHPPLIVVSENDATLVYSKAVTHAKTNPFKTISIYPNPVSDCLHLSATLNEPMCVKIMDLNGRTRLVGDFETRNSCISVNTLEPGIYIMVCHSDAGFFASKFRKK